MMPGNLMKISELAHTAGVSKQTIHFYLREGLLSPPVQSSRNMAYYDFRHLEEIRLIKDLQERHYLPLAVIKLVLENKRSGGDFALPDHIDIMEAVFLEAKNERNERHRSLPELLEETELSEEILVQLESLGLLTPELVSEGKRYDGYDAAIAMAIGRVLDLGLETGDLQLYGQLLEIHRAEARLVHERIIHRSDKSPHPELKDIDMAFMNIRSLLAAKVKRELFMDHPYADEAKKEEAGC